MDKDRIDGLASKVTGNERLEAEVVDEKVGGKVQEGVGKGKDAVRDVLKP